MYHHTYTREDLVNIIRNRCTLTGAIICAFITATAMSAVAQTSLSKIQEFPFVQNKKVIEFGWDCPTARWVKTNVASMEQKPFDGVVMWPGSNLIIAWQPTDWRNDPAYLDHASLAATNFVKFEGNNFFLVWTSNNWSLDYWDDALWTKINANQGALAKAAKDYNFAGILFDVEFYSKTSPWGFTDMGRGHTLAETQAKLRQRGREMMTAWQTNYPTIAILSTYWLNYIPANWELLPHFVNGLLDVIGPDVRIIEGNEESYYWTNTKSFFDRYAGTKTNKESRGAPLDPAHEAKWDKQVQCGQSAYWDEYMTTNPSDNLKKRWEAHFYASLCTTDEWVWLWTERMNWWGVPTSDQPIGWNIGTTGIYPGSAEGITNAKRKYAAGQALGWEVMSGQVDSSVTVRITAPANQSIHAIGATITVPVTATGGTINAVELYVNAVKHATDQSAPYSFTLSGTPAGEYTLIARAKNSSNRYGMSNPVTFAVKGGTGIVSSTALPRRAAMPFGQPQIYDSQGRRIAGAPGQMRSGNSHGVYFESVESDNRVGARIRMTW